MADTYSKIGVNVIVLDHDKVLLGLRKGVAGDGTWGVPGGKLEFLELVTEGAKRELLEETGLIADELQFIGINNQPKPSSKEHYLQINFFASIWHGELKNMEPDVCEKWDWFDINDLPKPMFYAHKDFIRDYLNKNYIRDEAV